MLLVVKALNGASSSISGRCAALTLWAGRSGGQPVGRCCCCCLVPEGTFRPGSFGTVVPREAVFNPGQRIVWLHVNTAIGTGWEPREIAGGPVDI